MSETRRPYCYQKFEFLSDTWYGETKDGLWIRQENREILIPPRISFQDFQRTLRLAVKNGLTFLNIMHRPEPTKTGILWREFLTFSRGAEKHWILALETTPELNKKHTKFLSMTALYWPCTTYLQQAKIEELHGTERGLIWIPNQSLLKALAVCKKHFQEIESLKPNPPRFVAQLLMDERGLDESTVAKRLGIPLADFVAILDGHRLPPTTVEEWERWCTAMGFPPSEGRIGYRKWFCSECVSQYLPDFEPYAQFGRKDLEEIVRRMMVQGQTKNKQS